MSHVINPLFQQSLPDNFNDCRIKKKGLVKTVQVSPFSVSQKWLETTENTDGYNQVFLFSVNRISWPSVTRSRLVYRTIYQRSSRKISPWRSRARQSPISCAIHCSVSNCKVYRKLKVWSSSLSIYCQRDVCENPANGRKMDICADPGCSWDTFTQVKDRYEVLPREIVTTVTLWKDQRCFESWQIV